MGACARERARPACVARGISPLSGDISGTWLPQVSLRSTCGNQVAEITTRLVVRNGDMVGSSGRVEHGCRVDERFLAPPLGEGFDAHGRDQGVDLTCMAAQGPHLTFEHFPVAADLEGQLSFRSDRRR